MAQVENRLGEMFMSFILLRSEEEWLDAAIEFKNEHNRKPRRTSEDQKEKQIANWIERVKRKKRGKYTKMHLGWLDTKAKINGISGWFGREIKSEEECFAEVLAFKDKYNRKPVVVAGGIEERRVGRWISKITSAYKAQRRKKENLDVFHMIKKTKKYPEWLDEKAEAHGIIDWFRPTKADWRDKFEQLIQFKKKHGRRPEWGDKGNDRKLHLWVRKMIDLRNKPSRIHEYPEWLDAKAEAHGITDWFLFSRSRIMHLNSFDRLIAFKKKHNRKPERSKKDKKESQLYYWVQGMIRFRKNESSHYPKWLDEKAEAHGIADWFEIFKFDIINLNYFDLLIEFKEKNNRKPKLNKKDKKELQLYCWVREMIKRKDSKSPHYPKWLNKKAEDHAIADWFVRPNQKKFIINRRMHLRSFNNLLKFKKSMGRPPNKSEDELEIKLYIWVLSMSNEILKEKQGKTNKCPKWLKRRAKNNGILEWFIPPVTKTAEEWFSDLINFKLEFNRKPIRDRLPKNKRENSLAYWISDMKRTGQRAGDRKKPEWLDEKAKEYGIADWFSTSENQSANLSQSPIQ